MPAVRLNRKFAVLDQHQPSPLPELLQTPAGLAIIEIQGTIHAPVSDTSSTNESVEVGRLEFPLYDSDKHDTSDSSWMKKVHLYVGKHQRLTGEIKKLAKPLVIIAKKEEEPNDLNDAGPGTDHNVDDQLDMLAIIKYKILFSNRPEPVGM